MSRPLRLAMTAAHGGYGSEQLPLGGAAAICERLGAAWAGRPEVDLTLLAPGPGATKGRRYLRVDVLEGRSPSSLSELAYARFCRRFERALSAALIRERPDAVLVHDISEGPTFSALQRHGIPCVPILHVDVVDYFCRMYLRQAVSPRRAEACMRLLRPWPVVPDLLRLVFDKQADAVASCPHLVVPSEGMADLLQQTYPALRPGQVVVIPWGSPTSEPPADEVATARRELDEDLGLDPGAPVVLTLSRISPEKGQDLLLQAMAVGERLGEIPPGLTLVLCGEAAYMQGPPFMARLRRLARDLDQVRVVFLGHLGGCSQEGRPGTGRSLRLGQSPRKLRADHDGGPGRRHPGPGPGHPGSPPGPGPGLRPNPAAAGQPARVAVAGDKGHAGRPGEPGPHGRRRPTASVSATLQPGRRPSSGIAGRPARLRILLRGPGNRDGRAQELLRESQGFWASQREDLHEGGPRGVHRGQPWFFGLEPVLHRGVAEPEELRRLVRPPLAGQVQRRHP